MEGNKNNTKLLGYEQKKILFNAMVVDGIQFLESSLIKLQLAHLELCSLRNIKKGINNSYEQWNSKLMEKGSFSDFPERNFDYFSNIIPEEMAFLLILYINL